MSKFKAIFDTAKEIMVKNSPSILTGVGIFGMVTATITACKATPKAQKLLAKKREEKEIVASVNTDTENEVSLTPWEVICEGAKAYWPSFAIGGVSIACLIFANRVNLRRNAALIAAYQLSENKLKDYQEEVIKEFGKNKEEKVRTEIVKKELEKNPPDMSKIILTSDAEVLCYDRLSGRYFKSNTTNLRRAEASINRRLINECTVTLNDFYDELSSYGAYLEPIDIGDDLGWGMFNTGDILELDLTTAKITEDGTPCICLDYNIRPMWLGYGES